MILQDFNYFNESNIFYNLLIFLSFILKFSEGIHREKCGNTDLFVIQWRRFAKGRDLSNKGNDAFMLNVFGMAWATQSTDNVNYAG